MADWDNETWLRPRMAPRPVVKYVPSNNTPIASEKSGWKGWAQLEVYYHALGKGFDITLKRSPSPPAGSVDLKLYDDFDAEDRDEGAILAELKAAGTDRDLEHEFFMMVRDWARLNFNLENLAKK